MLALTPAALGWRFGHVSRRCSAGKGGGGERCRPLFVDGGVFLCSRVETAVEAESTEYDGMPQRTSSSSLCGSYNK